MVVMIGLFCTFIAVWAKYELTKSSGSELDLVASEVTSGTSSDATILEMCRNSNGAIWLESVLPWHQPVFFAI